MSMACPSRRRGPARSSRRTCRVLYPGTVTLEGEKRAAAEYAAGLVEDGMRVGLGTGTTVAPLIPALAARGLRLRCVATSEATARAAEAAGLTLDTLDAVGELDI